MKSPKLIWQIFPPFLAIAVATLLATAWYSSKSFNKLYYEQLADNLKAQCNLIEPQIMANFSQIDTVCKTLGKKGGLRITVILPDGQVVGDSDSNPATMKDHSDRPEFKEALSGGVGKAIRFSDTLGKSMMYLAVAVTKDSQIVMVVRTALPITVAEKGLTTLHEKILWTGLVITICAAVASWVVSRKISTPVEQMTEAAERFAAGDFSGRTVIPNTQELAELAKTLNEMAERIGGRIDTITKDQNETQAVLASMNRLENIRRDFVANVSHELKTPITSIKGFVETLLEEGANNPEQTQNFLKIIARHTDRLDAIINDLLALCRLEEDGQKRNLNFEQQPLRPAIVSAIELAKLKADTKKITVELDCANFITAKINAALLEQAVLNLIDNAVKYSSDGSKIKIDVKKSDGQIEIIVADTGCGIDSEHLDRIFERFYVVDKARSRKLGGTGLGLAIVKHIAQVHDGSVSVESTIGKGSIFTIHLPFK
ncbi:MAG: ATP-binding protein [Phycisphaerae bacterium]|jgi:two-component system phosphate regulon sensor histidine kinase PhoR